MSKSIAEIFETDPLSLTDQDIDALIHEFRGKRAMFLASGQKVPKKNNNKELTAEEKKQAEDLLSELGL